MLLQKIILPEEPEENDPDSLQIVLRSPLGQNHTRRFLYSNTLQVSLFFNIFYEMCNIQALQTGHNFV